MSWWLSIKDRRWVELDTVLTKRERGMTDSRLSGKSIGITDAGARFLAGYCALYNNGTVLMVDAAGDVRMREAFRRTVGLHMWIVERSKIRFTEIEKDRIRIETEAVRSLTGCYHPDTMWNMGAVEWSEAFDADDPGSRVDAAMVMSAPVKAMADIRAIYPFLKPGDTLVAVVPRALLAEPVDQAHYEFIVWLHEREAEHFRFEPEWTVETQKGLDLRVLSVPRRFRFVDDGELELWT